MPLPIDAPGPVRPGETLDEGRLSDHLAGHLDGFVGPARVAQFPHGHSNLTYLITDAGGREYVLRRPPFGNRVASAHDMTREARLLTRLAPVYRLAPRPLLSEEDGSVIGAPFFVMERRPGAVLRRDSAVDAGTLRRAVGSMMGALAGLHAIDLIPAGLGDLGHPEGYAARQVAGWSRRDRDARTAARPSLDRVSAWLAAETPDDRPPAVVHNDFKLDNLVLDPDDPAEVRAVLDWEMATVGDPLMDLGTTLAYWVEAGDPESLRVLAAGPTTLPGAPTRADLIDAYGRAAGRTLPGLTFYRVFGLFKVAVIAEQIHARYVRGATADPRFLALGGVVDALGDAALELLG